MSRTNAVISKCLTRSLLQYEHIQDTSLCHYDDNIDLLGGYHIFFLYSKFKSPSFTIFITHVHHIVFIIVVYVIIITFICLVYVIIITLYV